MTTADHRPAGFHEFFQRAMLGKEPYPYQTAFAEDESLPELLSIPTGVAKTATVVLGHGKRAFPVKAAGSTTSLRLLPVAFVFQSQGDRHV